MPRIFTDEQAIQLPDSGVWTDFKHCVVGLRGSCCRVGTKASVEAKESEVEKLEEEAGFNPSDFIIHHVADAHEIHLWGEGEGAVHIPLPVILYSEKYGLDVFMSSAFEGHGDVKSTKDGRYVMSHGHISIAGEHEAHGDHEGHDHAHSEEGPKIVRLQHH